MLVDPRSQTQQLVILGLYLHLHLLHLLPCLLHEHIVLFNLLPLQHGIFCEAFLALKRLIDQLVLLYQSLVGFRYFFLEQDALLGSKYAYLRLFLGFNKLCYASLDLLK